MKIHQKISARILSIALTAAMVCTMLPLAALAAEVQPSTAGLTGCHPAHDVDCGYTAAAEGMAGAPCLHRCNLCQTTENGNAPALSQAAQAFVDAVAALNQAAIQDAARAVHAAVQSDSTADLDELTADFEAANAPVTDAEHLYRVLSDEEQQMAQVQSASAVLSALVAALETTAGNGKGAIAVNTDPLPTVEIISDTNFIFANGNALVIEGTSNASTTVYIDTNRNGVKDTDEPSLASANISSAPENGSDLSSWFICGGTNTSAFTGNTLITMNSGCVSTIVGGCYNAAMEGNTTVRVKGGTVKNSIASGNRSAGSVTGNTDITIENGVINQIFLNIDNVTISGNVSVTISGGTIQRVRLEGTIGGGKN